MVAEPACGARILERVSAASGDGCLVIERGETLLVGRRSHAVAAVDHALTTVVTPTKLMFVVHRPESSRRFRTIFTVLLLYVYHISMLPHLLHLIRLRT
jgi:hypothetical protein